MKFSDVFKKSFLQGFSTVEMSTTQILVVLALTTIIALYIFFCYRIMTRRTFYSKNFNISLVAMAILTSGIILTIQSSVVVSLGMVGALSIVRFRTAIKDPLDLIFLFWSIGVGIICGAGLVEIAILTSLLVTLVLFVLDRMPVAKAPMILVVDGESEEGVTESITKAVEQHTRYYTIKTKTVSKGKVDLVIELRVKDGEKLVDEISKLDKITNVSLLSHDGEVTF